jgi:hypothetical protein
LLNFVVRNAAGPPELISQCQNAVVDRHCSCGCLSVGLRSDGAEVAADWLERQNPHPNHRVAQLRAEGSDARGRDVDVILTIVDGRIEELEIYCWTEEDGVTSDPVDESTLRYGSA